MVAGSGFDLSAGRYQVTFGGEAVSATVITSSTLRCTSPAHPPGEVLLGLVQHTLMDATVFAPDGTHFLFAAPPAVHTLQPSRGSAAGGYELVISGANFAPTVPVKAVFGGEEGVGATVLSSSTILVRPLLTHPTP